MPKYSRAPCISLARSAWNWGSLSRRSSLTPVWNAGSPPSPGRTGPRSRSLAAESSRLALTCTASTTARPTRAISIAAADGGHGRSPPPHPPPGALGQRLGPGRDRLAGQPPAEVVGQRLGRAIAPGRVLLQALQADLIEGRGHDRVEPRRRIGRLFAAAARSSRAPSSPRTAPGRSAAHRGSPRARRRPTPWSPPPGRPTPARATCNPASP